MKIPFEWLKEYVDFDCTARDLAEKLTFAGLEVESVDTVESEPVFDIEVTPNRPDCLGVIGVAREVAAIYGTKIRFPSADLAEEGEPAESLTNIEVHDKDKCGKYTARILRGVNVGPGPAWLRKRLVQCGMNPVNNVVDVTNYVLMECGHPLHAFDKRKLSEERIVVRNAGKGETITTLDGEARRLDPDVLVIADSSKPAAVAGIMGGAESEISPSTESIILESAYFDPRNIRSASKKLSLETESSARFERGADIGIVEWASRRAAFLIAEIAEARVAPGCVDVSGLQAETKTIECRFDRVRRLLGVEIDDQVILSILRSLELKPDERIPGSCSVKVPTFRVDLKREADLIEEVARIHGLDKVPDDRPRAAVIPSADDSGLRAVFALRSNLTALGLAEIVNYSFVSDEVLDLFEGEEPEEAKRIRPVNPNNRRENVLRTSLLPQMAETLGANTARQTPEAACFELGRVYRKHGDGASSEEERLCIGLSGKAGQAAGSGRRPAGNGEVFLRLKGIIESLASVQGAGGVEFRPGNGTPWSETAQVDIAVDGSLCGRMGVLSPRVRGRWRLSEPVGLLEMSTKPLLLNIFNTPRIEKVCPYPAVFRDIAAIVDRSVKHGDIVRTLWKNAPSELTSVTLFDIYTGSGIGRGKKSLAYSLVFRSPEGTLTDERVNGFRDALKKALETELEAEIRE
ncbi:MAG: phenylalanine--tRNA ligase subunit beta [Kiritimatiellia bacterium]